MIAFLFGPPGSGRTTQANMLEGHWGLVHLSTRHLLRRELEGRTPLGLKAMDCIVKGQLVPDEVIYKVLAHRLSKVDLKKKDVVLNGFPRTVDQFLALKSALKEKGFAVSKAVELTMPKDELTRRVLGRRICVQCAYTYHIAYKPPQMEGICDHCGQGLEPNPDDSPEILEIKLASYEKTTAPLRSLLIKEGLYEKVDSHHSVENVHRTLSEVLGLRDEANMEGDPLSLLLSHGVIIQCANCRKIIHATHDEIDEARESKIPVAVSTTMPDQRIFGFVGERSGNVSRAGKRQKR